VFNLSSQGLSQYEIAKVLRVSQPLINSDLQYLRAQFREALRNHIEHELPLIYNQTMNGISQVIQRAYAIHDTPRVPEQIRLHALNLIAECQQRRLDMATSGSIIEQGLSYVERMRANVNNLVRAIPQDQVREILHDEEAEEVLLGDDESSESERNNDEDSDISDGGDVHVSDGEDLNGNEDSSSASTSQSAENQSTDESLSLADPNNPSSTTEDDDNLEEDSVRDTTGGSTTTITVF
jgi:hypothetical protein